MMVPSLRDSVPVSLLTPHLRAGLMDAVAGATPRSSLAIY